MMIKHNEFEKYSEQQVIDCDT
jgi:hypothetical protein